MGRGGEQNKDLNDSNFFHIQCIAHIQFVEYSANVLIIEPLVVGLKIMVGT